MVCRRTDKFLRKGREKMASDSQTKSIFNTDSEDRVESPEKINEYIRVGGPGTYLIVGALLLVLVALVIWGLTGTLPVTETVTSVVDSSNDNHITCFADASRFSPVGLVGKQVSIHLSDNTSVLGTVEYVSDTPMSGEQAEALIGNDWLADNLVDFQYSYVMSIEPESDLSAYGYQLVSASIITEEVPPYRFLMR